MAVGDIMISANRGTGGMIRSHGPAYPFEKIRSVVGGADIVFGNLETPLSTRGSASARQDPHITFRAAPEAVHGLKFFGFDVLSLANNHMNDYGAPALLDTVRILGEHGIACTGAGSDSTEAHREVVLERRGLTIAFLAYDTFINIRTRPASRGAPGVALFDRRAAARAITRLKGRVDVIVVSMHWGLDFTEHPVPFQMKHAREMIDRGAHVIVGHHPHLLQGIERYGRGIIAYSLGDFVFDEAGRDTCVLKIDLSKQGIEAVDVIPARISAGLQTEALAGPEAAAVRRKIDALSAADAANDPLTAQRMLDDFIWTNLHMLKLSRNPYVLRNVCSPRVIRRMITRLPGKAGKLLGRRGAAR
jgi:poly-gamma-glutamate synthesis protein (capsule biosynthesis protein)